MEILNMTAFIIWDPPREVFSFSLPLLGRPILWYGVLFALGFFAGYKVFARLVRKEFSGNEAKILAKRLSEKTLMAVGLGAIIGARLGDILFYQDISTWIHHPISILYVWEGGLASHGAAIGILIGLAVLVRKLRKEKPFSSYRFFSLLDRAVLSVAIAGFFIRIGNFINQEILGTPTAMPWGVLFLHPADGGPIVPRHPVQLYESFAYLALFALLYTLWNRRPSFRREGLSTGLFLVLLFGFRFLIEFFKIEQSDYSLSFLTMGQLLSIPFILLGFYLLRRKLSLSERSSRT